MATQRMPGQVHVELNPDPSLAFNTGHASGIESLEAMGVHTYPTKEDGATDEKKDMDDGIRAFSLDEEASGDGKKELTAAQKVGDMENIALYALEVEDDPSLNPWTFRTMFLGIGLSCFSAVLATIYQFKPQGIVLSATFLTVVSYVMAVILELIPKSGFIGRWFNPHPFNHKEHAAILIMSSTAARSAMAAEVIAVQRLWYTEVPNAAVCIFLIFSSQCLGYGIAGLLRKVLVYPTKVRSSHHFKAYDQITLL